MIRIDDLDRTLAGWFELEATPPPPGDLVDRVVVATAHRRPRLGLVAYLRQVAAGPSTTWVGRVQPAVRLAIVVGLALLAIAGIALVGAQLEDDSVVPAPRVYTGELLSAGDLATARAWPFVVELQDGRVLVIGSNSGPETTAELFHPTTGGHVVAGPMVSAKALSTSAAQRLRDGRVLIVGDARPFDGPFFGMAQLFDPATSTFKSTGPMVTSRAEAKLAMLPDGRVLVAGGTPPNDPNTALASAEIFDPDSGTFTATGAMATARWLHAMVPASNGSVLVFGGQTTYSDAGTLVPGVEVYDPASGTFTADELPVGAIVTSWERGGDIVVALPEGRVIAFGQPPEGAPVDDRSVAEAWDPATSTFERVGTVLPAIKSAVALDDGRVLVTWNPSPNASQIGIFDPATGVLDQVDATRAWDPVLARLSDGRVLVVGGITDGNIRPENGGQLAPAVPTIEVFQ